MALLAATTLGGGAKTLRAEVKADAELADGGDYRLVVQTYDANDAKIPGVHARPVGSTQRAITGAELRRGVNVDVVEFTGQAPVVVAWVEGGKPDLDFDARRARPLPGSRYGVVRRAGQESAVQIKLSRTAA